MTRVHRLYKAGLSELYNTITVSTYVIKTQIKLIYLKNVLRRLERWKNSLKTCHKKISITFQLELPHKFIIFLLTDMPHQMMVDKGGERTILKDQLNIIQMTSKFNQFNQVSVLSIMWSYRVTIIKMLSVF